MIKILISATLLFASADCTGEGATWLKERQQLLWVDIDRGLLHSYTPACGTFTADRLPEMITSIIPVKGNKNEVVLAMKNRLVVYDLDLCKFRHLAEVDTRDPQWRTNDCKCAPYGTLWCGIMRMSDQNRNGWVTAMDARGNSNVLIDRQSIPNGVVWNPKTKKLYYADSGRGCIEEYAYDEHSGSISYVRTAINVPAEYGIPDGMTIDADGRLWVAHWGGYGVYVWNPETGKCEGKVAVPVPNVASCTFGADHKLYITTARDGLTADQLARYTESGGLYVADVPDVRPGENHYPMPI